MTPTKLQKHSRDLARLIKAADAVADMLGTHIDGLHPLRDHDSILREERALRVLRGCAGPLPGAVVTPPALPRIETRDMPLRAVLRRVAYDYEDRGWLCWATVEFLECGHLIEVGPNEHRPARRRRCWRCAHGLSAVWPHDQPWYKGQEEVDVA